MDGRLNAVLFMDIFMDNSMDIYGIFRMDKNMDRNQLVKKVQKRASKNKLLTLFCKIGTADGIRTHDLQSRSLALYPAELQPRLHIGQCIIANKSNKVNSSFHFPQSVL